MSSSLDNRLSSPDGEQGPVTLTDRVRSLRLADNVTPGRMRGSRLPWLLCLVLLATSLALGYQAYRSRLGDSAAPTQAPRPTDSDTVAGSGDIALESKGYIIPAHQIQVSPKVSGMVMKLNIEEGQRVKKGEVLAELETVDYQSARDHAEATVRLAQAQMEEADAEIQRSKADLGQAEAKLLQTERDWDRAQKLGPSGVIATNDFDTMKMNFQTAQANVAVSRASIVKAEKARIQAERTKMQAEADLVRAQWQLDNCKVVAPVTGTILTKKAEEGNIVNPIAFNVSASLCDMADLSDLEVDLSIQERDIAQVFKGQKCRIVAEAYPDRPPYQGYVSRLMPTADRAKGALPVRVKLHVPREEEGVYLRPDMGVIVSFLKKDR